jgi:hypothetical protein
MSNRRGTAPNVHPLLPELEESTKQRARLIVAGYAWDAIDLADLLTVLGLMSIRVPA